MRYVRALHQLGRQAEIEEEKVNRIFNQISKIINVFKERIVIS
jgi:hypothetical protein